MYHLVPTVTLALTIHGVWAPGTGIAAPPDKTALLGSSQTSAYFDLPTSGDVVPRPAVLQLGEMLRPGANRPVPYTMGSLKLASATETTAIPAIPLAQDHADVHAAPPQAAAAGYTTLTFGPDVTIGKNWHRMNFFGLNPSTMNVAQNDDGSVTVAGPWTFNAQISSARMGGSLEGWSGIAFGGGGYFEATLKWDNLYNGYGQPRSTGWPAWWANDIEGMSNLYNTKWPGVAPPIARNIEVDFMEYWSLTKWGAALHDWYGTKNLVVGATTELSGTNGNAVHRYGFLWIPATASTKGRAEFYFDGTLQPQMTRTWNLHDRNSRPPPVEGTTAWSHLDTRHLALLLGSGRGNPMTVYKVVVWQKSSANNISGRNSGSSRRPTATTTSSVPSESAQPR